MPRETAKVELLALVGPEVSPMLPPELIEMALDRSLCPDGDGRAPGEPGYVSTFDAAWAAAEAVTMLGIHATGSPAVGRITVEGASFDTAPIDWDALAVKLRARSPLGRALIREGGNWGIIDLTPEPPQAGPVTL